ncbi:MAG: ubiquinone biosynthesis protein [Comamonadaceae bacterium]|nr:MAG: ubiquinone biosynthesis protein [Comamonadaceae bacterium]
MQETDLAPRTKSPYERDLPAAFHAVRKLLSNPDDTTQVFVIMRALNGRMQVRNFERLMKTQGGPRLVYRRLELAEKFSDPAFIASFEAGTVGAAYRDFLNATGYTAAGLVEVSNLDNEPLAEHPYAWCGRRQRDVHDIWHVLTGYQADDPLGEAALVAFSYAQTGGLGWGFIALAAVLKSLRERQPSVARAIVEGYRNGRKAAWLMGEDYEALLQEPLAAARARLGIAEPAAYAVAREQMLAQA